MSELPISVDKEKCISCSLCVTACTFAVIEMEDGRISTVDGRPA